MKKLGIACLISSLIMFVFFVVQKNVLNDIIIPDSCGIIQGLCAVGSVFIFKDYFDYKNIVKMVCEGDFINIAATMSSLEKMDVPKYEKIMSQCKSVFKNKAKEYDNRHSKNFKKLNDMKTCYEMFNNVLKGEKTWDEIYKEIIHEKNICFTLKYLIDDCDEKDVARIQKELVHINSIKSGGNSVHIKE